MPSTSVEREPSAQAVAGQGEPRADSALWSALGSASGVADGAQPWLDILASAKPMPLAGLVLAGRDRRGARPVATWPRGASVDPALGEMARLALDEGRGVLREGEDACRIAYPVRLGQTNAGSAALALPKGADMQGAMRRLQWGVGGLRDIARREAADPDAREDPLFLLDLMAEMLSPPGFTGAAQALVDGLTDRLGLERAALGLCHGRQTKVRAISGSAGFGQQMRLVRMIGYAMDEAIGQRANLLLTEGQADDALIRRAHRDLARVHGSGEILTVPLTRDGEPVGALLLEFASGGRFDQAAIDRLALLAAFAGPILVQRRELDRPLPLKAWDAAHRQIARLIGPGYPRRKLAAAALVVLVAVLGFIPVPYSVGADARVEGEVQRAVVAPFEGFLLEAFVRAGDRVAQGDLLATLDTSDLALERLNWLAERRERQFAYDRALNDRALDQINVLKARVEQADIRMRMIDAQIERAALRAPIDGLVIAGDLSQSIGASVRRGDVLFELSPADRFRLILEVDEGQIGHVAPGATGAFLSPALIGPPQPFSVTAITPVARPVEGRTVFVVEADVEGGTERLRPGMDGIAKIAAGERSLAWIWTRAFAEWARMVWWRWTGA